MAVILDGKALAKETEAALTERVRKFKERTGRVPQLATILVGNNPASATYVKMKGNACARVGMLSKRIEMPGETTTEQLLGQIGALNADPLVDGILLQHPVPKHIDERAAFEAISLEKDVDGVTSLGFGRMSMGCGAYGSATPTGIMRLLDHYKIDIEGKFAVVIGRSPIIGKPMAMMLLNRNATVVICHSKTRGLPDIMRYADIIIGAVGKPKFIKASWIMDGAVVVDAGYHPGNVGDIDLEGASFKAGAYTPIPGGVGPMTISTLILQTMDAAEKSVS
ncbi:MAG: bifunctional 5,10-methylene-tetrahydrofolate dehydrogenase/5,10-methylene-tetrahydrofolate cyclohydrolase [Chitinispirillia bacterium]|nr:bifunctional 5,10-methylene-tetrahydrofolate dehydrogenase/5,10-methylene-tetrahydrofolate cyclohydrolase [Chitinispirillia bacterium]MCL2242341.1 bifunctional 5,10-methylene-tetrahydrofolate dehydrogenase/5,10-methylene-tetrahydrofolate cyclohydrolase [Chitinispirillia bacterium]